MRMPGADVSCSVDLVHALVRDQHPDLAGLPLHDAGEGWDNRLFRLGPDFIVRLPRRQVGAAAIEHEQRWLPVLAPRLAVPVPVPVRIGRPGCGFPWSWSIVPWFSGQTARDVPHDIHAALAAFLVALHQPAPAEAPVNVYRTTLASRREAFEKHMAIVAGADPAFDRSRAIWTWASAQDVRPWDGAPLWLHGDLHPANLIVHYAGHSAGHYAGHSAGHPAGHDGGLAAVIDFGDLTSGDPAVDLAVAWMLWPAATRARFRRAVDASSRWTDEAVWQRARGWALALGMALSANSDDNPPMHALGRRTVDAVLAD